ncbi:pyridoxal phosphate-dependent decarboxylase family protein [Flagellimonas sp. 2504JD1-5]
MNIQDKMLGESNDPTAFEKAKEYAIKYMSNVDSSRVYPNDYEIDALKVFHVPLTNLPSTSVEVLDALATIGVKGTVAQTGGRYFGFVNGGAVPASLPVKWLADVWDQCGGLYLTSPINAELEIVCERWLKELFNLPPETIAGFVSGTSMANLSALAAARLHLLKKQGWHVNEKGLNGAPALRIIAHDQIHASIKKTLAMLGYGKNSIEWIPSDDQGRAIVHQIPKLDHTCLVLLQAGNANTGSFDDFNTACDLANEVGAWTHIDGAFGLWAAATKKLSYLTDGMEKACSWAVDGHKTLNTPYDSGIVLCRHPQSLIGALQATGEYILYSEKKDPLLTTPELSKRSRAIELWATMKSLGKHGIDEMVFGFHQHARQLEKGLRNIGYTVLNEVVFNQVLVRFESDEKTNKIIDYVQNSGVCWVGGTTWKGEVAIRISICSWRTTTKDIEMSIEVFGKALEAKGMES